jgi:hypothetical protein
MRRWAGIVREGLNSAQRIWSPAQLVRVRAWPAGEEKQRQEPATGWVNVVDAVALELNERPRQTLGFKSPSQALDRLNPQA